MKLFYNLAATVFCIVTLGLVDIQIKYSDGTRFKWVGWITRLIRKSKSVDEKFREIGFVKVNENEHLVHYQRHEHSFIQTLCLGHKDSGRHIVQSYDETLTDSEGIGNTCVGLTMYEMELCIKKMKQLGWESGAR